LAVSAFPLALADALALGAADAAASGVAAVGFALVVTVAAVLDVAAVLASLEVAPPPLPDDPLSGQPPRSGANETRREQRHACLILMCDVRASTSCGAFGPFASCNARRASIGVTDS
jgi:hypothetical protein